MVGGGTLESVFELSGEICFRGDGNRSQSLHSTDAIVAKRYGQHNRNLGKGGRKIDMKTPIFTTNQER